MCINKLKVDDPVNQVLYLEKTEKKKSKDKEYLQFYFKDKTGAIDGVLFDEKTVAKIEGGAGFYRVSGHVREYRGKKSLNLTFIRPAEKDEFDEKSFFESTEKDTKIMYAELLSIIHNVSDNDYKSLLLSCFGNQKIEKMFSDAAALRHHVYIGGLLEHTLAVTKVCIIHSQIYGVDKDLLLTAALLHDIGVLKSNTPMGKLKGHIYIGAEMVSNMSKKVKVPEGKVAALMHCILSHHAQGCISPQTLEGRILMSVNELDIRLNMPR